MKKLYRIIGVILLATALAGCQQDNAATQEFAATDITGGPWGGNFQLVDHNGQLRTIADFEGKAVVVFFGYTNCPDVCPTTMAKLASVMEQLGSDAERVQVLMVTLDPKRDTPEILKKYAPAFHPSFLGLRGNEQQTESTAKEFKTLRTLQSPDENGSYTVDHSGGTYAYDPHGRLRLYINDQHSVETIAKDIRALLKT
ncbi:MAG: SCO family protein [Burkholderiaceae bacterium]